MDNSLKFYPKYLKWEPLWSEEHKRMIRFVCYTNKERTEAKVAEMDSIAEISGTVSVANLRRPNA